MLSSFWYCDKLLDVFVWLLLYSIRLCIGISTSRSFALSTCVLFILLISISKWCTIFRYCLCIFLICSLCCSMCCCSSNWYSSLDNDITEIWLKRYSFELDLTICIISSTCTTHFNPLYVQNLDGWLVVLWSKFIIFWYSILSLHIDVYNNLSLSIIQLLFWWYVFLFWYFYCYSY